MTTTHDPTRSPDWCPRETFRCASCKRDVPWSGGCADAAPDICDDCAAPVARWMRAVEDDRTPFWTWAVEEWP